MTEKGGENINHQELAKDFVERDLEGLKELLKIFEGLKDGGNNLSLKDGGGSINKESTIKNGGGNINEKLFKKVDYNDESLSNAESNLFSAIKKLDSLDKQMSLVDSLIKILEAKNKKSEGFLNKTVNEMSEGELVKAFDYINDNRGYINNDIGAWWEDTISELDSELEISSFKRKIINKLKNNFPSKYIDFKDGRGDFQILDLQKFEKDNKGKHPLDISGSELEAYFENLISNNNGDILDLVEQKLGENIDKKDSVTFLDKLSVSFYSTKHLYKIKLLLEKSGVDFSSLGQGEENNMSDKEIAEKEKIYMKEFEEENNKDHYVKIDKSEKDDIKKSGKKMLEDFLTTSDNYFLENPELIYTFYNPENSGDTNILGKINSILNTAGEQGKKINLTNINQSLWQNFIGNENILIGLNDVQNMDPEFLNKNYDNLFERLLFYAKNDGKTPFFINFLTYVLGRGVKTEKCIIESLNKFYYKPSNIEDDLRKSLEENFNGSAISLVFNHDNFNYKKLDSGGIIQGLKSDRSKNNLFNKKNKNSQVNKIPDMSFADLRISLDTGNIDLESFYKHNYQLFDTSDKIIFCEYICKSGNDKIFKLFLDNNDYGQYNKLQIFPDKTQEMSKLLVQKDFKNIRFVDKKYINKDFFDVFFDSYDKLGEDGASGLSDYLSYFEFSDINDYLYMLDTISNKYGRGKISDIKNIKFWSDMTNAYFSSENINKKYIDNGLYNYLKKFGMGSRNIIKLESMIVTKKGEIGISSLTQPKIFDKLGSEKIKNLINNQAIYKDIIDIISKSLTKGQNTANIGGSILEKLDSVSGLLYSQKDTIISELMKKIKKLKVEEQKNNIEDLEKSEDFILLPNEYRNGEKFKGELFIKDFESFCGEIKEKAAKNSERYKHLVNKNGKIDIKKLKQLFFLEKDIKNENLISKLSGILKTQEDIAFTEIIRGNPKKASKIIKEYSEGNYESVYFFEKDVESGKVKIPGYTPKGSSSHENSTPSFQTFEVSGKTYNVANGIATLGDETINLSKQDENLIGKNPEALENLFNFSDVLQKVGLTKLWDIKEQIFTAIGNVKGQGFKLDGDYLNESEIMKFLNSIIVSVGEKEQTEATGLDDMVAKIQVLNKIQVFGGMKTENNLYGTTSIEEKFINNFIPRGNMVGFLAGNFTNAISGKSVYKN